MIAPACPSGKSIVMIVMIRYFLTSTLTIRLTQPAVSMQVRQLERELGLPLLERVGKRTYTTKAGELLLAHAGRAMQELDRGLELVQQLRGIVAGRIRLGTSASFSIYLLPTALRRFRARLSADRVRRRDGQCAGDHTSGGGERARHRDREPALPRAGAGGDLAPPRRARRDRATGPPLAARPAREGGGARARAPDPVRAGGDAPARDRRLVPARRRRAGPADGARQHRGDQEARRVGARPVGDLVVRGQGRRARATAQRGAARAAAVPSDRDRAPPGQAADAGPRRLPRDARRPASLPRVAGLPGRREVHFVAPAHWPICTRATNEYFPFPSGLKMDASPSLTSNQSLPRASRMFGLWVTTSVLVPASGGVPTIVRNACVRRLFSFGLTTCPPSLTSSVACGSLPPISLAVSTARYNWLDSDLPVGTTAARS